jgi:putative Ca2+/H+ antiporter (TMEM165/GDT1 family)
VLTAFLLSLLSQSRHRKKILLISGIVLTVLALTLLVYRIIAGFGQSIAIIGGIDRMLGLMIFFNLYRPVIGILILGILFIIFSFVLKKIDEKSSEKQESVIE